MTNLIKVFPHDPEQWIYAKATSYEKLFLIDKWKFKTPEDKLIAKLELEIRCLKKAINDFNEVYKKFLENPQND